MLRRLTLLLILAAVVEAASGQTVADCKGLKGDAERLACFDKNNPTVKTQQSLRNNIEAKARAAIAARMKDPDSTRIRSSKRFGDILCGTFNAKNSMGGYGETEMFVYLISRNKVLLLIAGDDDFREALSLWESSGCVYPR
jgi:hypothetical protein